MCLSTNRPAGLERRTPRTSRSAGPNGSHCHPHTPASSARRAELRVARPRAATSARVAAYSCRAHASWRMASMACICRTYGAYSVTAAARGSCSASGTWSTLSSVRTAQHCARRNTSCATRASHAHGASCCARSASSARSAESQRPARTWGQALRGAAAAAETCARPRGGSDTGSSTSGTSPSASQKDSASSARYMVRSAATAVMSNGEAWRTDPPDKVGCSDAPRVAGGSAPRVARPGAAAGFSSSAARVRRHAHWSCASAARRSHAGTPSSLRASAYKCVVGASGPLGASSGSGTGAVLVYRVRIAACDTMYPSDSATSCR